MQALDAPVAEKFHTRDEAVRIATARLNQQEPLLRSFIATYPGDPRSLDARLRLAHLLAVRSDLQNAPALYRAAMKLLGTLEDDPGTAPARKPDVAFAIISLHMRKLQEPAEAEREEIVGEAHKFESRFPGDRRIAPLLAELAGLYDSRPAAKKALLEEALRNNPSEAVTKRIDDDLRRLALLGSPVPVSFVSVRGDTVDVHQFAGKVVLLYFFADWSPQSVTGLGVVKDVLAQFRGDEVEALGVSLDVDKQSLLADLKTYKVSWPVCFDGKGWQGSLVRSLGINAIPTVWIFDRKGNLRTLSARDEAEAIVRGLLREP